MIKINPLKRTVKAQPEINVETSSRKSYPKSIEEATANLRNFVVQSKRPLSLKDKTIKKNDAAAAKPKIITKVFKKKKK